MSLRASYKHSNIDLTINQKIKADFETAKGYTGRVFYEDSLADPTSLDERITTLGYWIEVRILSHGMGQKQPTVVQIDCYHNVGDRNTQAAGDRYGHKTTAIADNFVDAMATADLAIRIQDFSTPLSPTNTDDWIIIRNQFGQFGWPTRRDRIPNDKGIIREVLTYHFWHMQDLSGVQGYF